MIQIKKDKGITSLKCFIIGHIFDLNMHDDNYAICDRCGMHEYYDNDPDYRSWPRMYDYPFWGKWWYKIKKAYSSLVLKKNQFKEYLYGNRFCVNCQKQTLNRKWHSNICPNCGHVDDLPF